jgi:hypothetical protein
MLRLTQMSHEEEVEWRAMRPERSKDDDGSWVPNLADKGCEVILSFICELLLYVKVIRPDGTFACQSVVELKSSHFRDTSPYVTNLCLCGVPKAYKVEFGPALPNVNHCTTKLEVMNKDETYPNWVHIFDTMEESFKCTDRRYLKAKVLPPLTQALRKGFHGAHEYLFPGYWRKENPGSTRKSFSGQRVLGRPFCFHWEHMSEVD